MPWERKVKGQRAKVKGEKNEGERPTVKGQGRKKQVTPLALAWGFDSREKIGL